MPEEKPSISELYKTGELDMDLVEKIAQNELEKFKWVNPGSVQALASEYIEVYTDSAYTEVIKEYAEVLDTDLTVEDYQGGRISPEFMLGAAIACGAHSHAYADIESWADEISSRSINELYDLSMSNVRFSCKAADEFSLAGVNPDRKFPIGFVSVKDVADTISELGSDHMKEALKPADMGRIASSLAEAEQRIDRDELADGIAYNMDLEMWKIKFKQDEQGLDDLCVAKSEEAELVADNATGEREAPDNEQDK